MSLAVFVFDDVRIGAGIRQQKIAMLIIMS